MDGELGVCSCAQQTQESNDPLCQCELRHLTPKNDAAPVVGGGDVDVALAMVSADPVSPKALRGAQRHHQKAFSSD